MKQHVRQLRLRLKPYGPTLRLTASYLAVIMVMSLTFSIVLYGISATEIGRQLPPNNFYGQYSDIDQDVFNEFFERRISRGQHEVFVRLAYMNLVVLLGGAAVSYILARRSLEPIEEAMEAQSRFASDASHELRTPLAAIQAENEVALRNPKLTLARSKELLASNLEEAKRLQAMSDSLLKLARQESTDIVLAPVLLPDAIQQATAHYAKAAQAKHIAVVYKPVSVTALADEDALVQALDVLLDNAIKYSPAGSTVTISSGRHGKEAFVTIADEGPGISKADLPYIFERFYRADSSRTSQKVSGHGLGLALAQKVIEQSGGTISAKSQPGKGAKFTVSFPLA